MDHYAGMVAGAGGMMMHYVPQKKVSGVGEPNSIKPKMDSAVLRGFFSSDLYQFLTLESIPFLSGCLPDCFPHLASDKKCFKKNPVFYSYFPHVLSGKRACETQTKGFLFPSSSPNVWRVEWGGVGGKRRC